MTSNKIFIIGLPRTATTSVCLSLLEAKFTVAHTAYTAKTFEQAQVIADTPIFVDYPLLDRKYLGSKFIYLERDLSVWIPSIKQLLARMYINLSRKDGGFNPHIKRCYNDVFDPLTRGNIEDDNFLINCYKRHLNEVANYFKDRESDLLRINVADKGSYSHLMEFLNVPMQHQNNNGFKKINIAGKVTAWNDIKHDNKIPSTNQGKIDKTL